MMYAITIGYTDQYGAPAVYSAIRGTVSDSTGFGRNDALSCANEIVEGIQGKRNRKLGWPAKFPRSRVKLLRCVPLW